MTDSDKGAFYALIGNVYGFYRVECTQFAYGVWWEGCKGFDFAAVADALNRHAVNPDNGQFLPKPADILKLLGGTTIDGAQVAWTKVDRAIRDVGPYQSVIFDDAIVHAVVADMGGWIELSRKDDEAWPFVQREFETRYRGYRNRPPLESVARLIGIFEMENGMNGRAIADPVLLGDPQRAMQVKARLSDAPRMTVTRLADVVPLLPNKGAA